MPASDADRSILILCCGGTIDKEYFDAKSDYQVGEPQVADILEKANLSIGVEIKSIVRKDSLDMTDHDRAMVREAVLQASATHILITHGTDSMADTARCLADIKDRTIVLTGSMQPARFRDSDATFNVGFALAALKTLPNGTYVAMNGEIFNPLTVIKNVQQGRFEAR